MAISNIRRLAACLAIVTGCLQAAPGADVLIANAKSQPESLMVGPIRGPDGMRAANGKLIVAENGIGKISVISVNGDKASVTVIKDGLKTPTALEPAGDTIWIADRGAGKAVSMPMPK